MKKTKRDITILALDDKLDYDEFKKFNQEQYSFMKRGFDYAAVNYKNILKGKFPEIKTKRLITNAAMSIGFNISQTLTPLARRAVISLCRFRFPRRNTHAIRVETGIIWVRINGVRYQ